MNSAACLTPLCLVTRRRLSSSSCSISFYGTFEILVLPFLLLIMITVWYVVEPGWVLLPLPFLEIGDQLCQNRNPKCSLKEESNSFLVLRIVCVSSIHTISWYEPKPGLWIQEHLCIAFAFHTSTPKASSSGSSSATCSTSSSRGASCNDGILIRN